MSPIIPIILTLGFLKSLEFIYIWQIKEYRLDRFISYLNEAGFLKVLYGLAPHKAAKSLRNLLITLLNTLLFIVLGILTVQIEVSIVFTIILIVLTPFFGFCVTSVTVFITSAFSRYKREQVIRHAKEKLKSSKTTFIGITGSYGKTTTKELLYNLISQKFRVEKTKETINTDVGIAMSVNGDLRENTEFFIAEIGAYKKGEIRKARQIIPLKYAILTAIGNQHLDLFGSRQNLIKAKLELLQDLEPGGKVYLNKDIKEYPNIASSLGNFVSFSITQKADIYVINVSSGAEGIHTKVKYGGRLFQFVFPLLGIHNLSNLLPAIALASDLGMGGREIEKAISALKPIKNKLSRHLGMNNSLVISDAGNSNVEGFLAATETLRLINKSKYRKKIIISKGIIELGPEKIDSYKRILKNLDTTDIVLYTTDKLFTDLHNKPNVILLAGEKEILQKIEKEVHKDTVILIEGKFSPGFINSLMG